MPDEAADYERARLASRAQASEQADVVLVEVVFGKKWVQFDLSTIELQHVPRAELIARTFAKALTDVGAPDEVTG